jgi:hypothetical protein
MLHTIRIFRGLLFLSSLFLFMTRLALKQHNQEKKGIKTNHRTNIITLCLVTKEEFLIHEATDAAQKDTND